ncbi:MAG: hypothetical protein IT210_14590 [Armatimonadetes bacterium]|nr:hypothetical protein [Armatimonadota bacterium]
MENELALMIPLAPFIMVVAIVYMSQRFKLEKMRMESKMRAGEDLERKLDELRKDYEQFILGFDARLKRIEGRLSRVESQANQTLSPAPDAAVSAEPEKVSVRRIEA